MSDLISRQDAIDALGEEPPVWYDGEDEIAERNQWRRDKAAIESLPSADAVQIPIKLEKRYPQSRDEDITDAFMRGYLAGRSSADRPTGKWIPNHHGFWYCSECGLRVLVYAKGNYYPNCGAKMGGGE